MAQLLVRLAILISVWSSRKGPRPVEQEQRRAFPDVQERADIALTPRNE